MARGLLVSYAGYPYALSSLFPDNGLASLAAVLRSEGHEIVILDYNTTETMRRMVDDESRDTLESLLTEIKGAPKEETVRRLVDAQRRIDICSRLTADEVGKQLINRCRLTGVDFVGFKLWNGDGYEASVRIAEQLRSMIPDIKLFAGGPSVK